MQRWAGAICQVTGLGICQRHLFQSLPRQPCTPETAPEIAPDIVRVTAAIDRLLLLAEGYYQSGMKGLVYLPPRAHIAIAVAANVYREIGQKRAAASWIGHKGGR